MIGILTKRGKKDYLSDDDLFATPGYGKFISRDRFFQIYKYFQIYNPDLVHEDKDKEHRFWKI